MDLEAGVRRVWPCHCPQEVLLGLLRLETILLNWSQVCQQLKLYLSQINIVKKFKSKPGVSVSIHPGLLFLLRRLFACFSHLPRRAQVTVFSLGASDSFLFVVFESLLVLREIFLRKRTRL